MRAAFTIKGDSETIRECINPVSRQNNKFSKKYNLTSKGASKTISCKGVKNNGNS